MYYLHGGTILLVYGTTGTIVQYTTYTPLMVPPQMETLHCDEIVSTSKRLIDFAVWHD